MRVIIRKVENFQEKQYCLLEFKGKFQSDYEDQHKRLLSLGQLSCLQNGNYRLQVGVMDLIGRPISIPKQQQWLYTQTIEGKLSNEKIILVKGRVSKVIMFDKRPIPNMLRADNNQQNKMSDNPIFKGRYSQNNKQKL